MLCMALATGPVSTPATSNLMATALLGPTMDVIKSHPYDVTPFSSMRLAMK